MQSAATSEKNKLRDGASRDSNSILFDDSSFFANISAAETSSRAPGNVSANSTALNVSALCCDEEISGFDRLSGRTWIYPTNYPVRDYQFNIIQATILNNTLVSLPTGLGKTFIAAVVMYNFYRWYPLGKIVFTAPTRPLVAQQINACYDIVAIPRADTIEMTGHMQVATRKTHWKEKRVFFATPQVIYNDLRSGACPADQIRCLVFDEAHRARGNYAYCQIVSHLSELGHTTYRVLALSATPGSKVDDVVSVVRSLQIAHLELRTEKCIDVARYSHSRKIHTVVVPLGSEINRLRQQYVEIVDTYARRLKQLNILSGNMGNLSKGRIVMLYKEYQSRDRGARHPQHNNIMRDFTILISLYHGLELLSRHGSRVFLNFFDEHTEKSWMQTDDRLTVLLERLRDDLGVNPMSLDRSTMPDGTIPQIPKNLTFGHPKFDHLKEIMTKHFNEAKASRRETKAIVFCEYRESVHLVHCLLLQCRPLIQPQMFVGQGNAGKEGASVVSQKAQLSVMRQFRAGACNALVATCVAEEGLDVGSVDLIVCFDISTRSPIRLVQRCGRTGRERGGQVFILVTEGREHQILQDCMRQRDNLTSKVLQSSQVRAALYQRNPRMLPRDFTPQCRHTHITVDRTADKKQKDLRSMLTERSSCGSCTDMSVVNGLMTKDEYARLYPDGPPRHDRLALPQEMWTLSADAIKAHCMEPQSSIQLSEWLEWQRTLQTPVQIDHSSDTHILSQLLQYADTRRFQLPPSTQQPDFNTQMLDASTEVFAPLPPEPKKKTILNKKKPKAMGEPNKKDGDIRALFSTTKKSTKQYTKVVNDLGISNATGLPTSLVDLLVDLCVQDNDVTMNCNTCKILNCSMLNILKNNNKIEPPESILSNTKLPDIKLLDEIDLESIEKAGEKITKCVINHISSEDKFIDDSICIEDIFSTDITLQKENKSEKQKTSSDNVNCTSNFDLEFDFNFDGSDVEESTSCENNISTTNFNIGGLEDIFADADTPDDTEFKKKIADCNNEKENPKKTLEFFGLESIDDIFAESNDDDIEVIENSPANKDDSLNYSKSPTFTEDRVPKPIQIVAPSSPSLLSGTQLVNDTIVTSPILCSQANPHLNKTVPTSPILCSQRNRVSHINLSVKASTPLPSKNNKKTSPNNEINIVDSINWSDFKEKSVVIPDKNAEHKTNNSTMGSKSLFTITQIIDMINQPAKTKITSPNSTSKNKLKPDQIESLNNSRTGSPILFNTQTSRNNHDETNINSIKKNCTEQSSPIICTYVSRTRCNVNTNKMCTKENASNDIVILDSDSDGTVNYSLTPDDLDCEKKTKDACLKTISLSRAKRKLDLDGDSMCSSTFFNKRTKINENSSKIKPSLSLKDKIKSIFPDKNKHDDPQINLAIIEDPSFQKENKSPNKFIVDLKSSKLKQMTMISFGDDFEFETSQPKSPILNTQRSIKESLQAFRKDSGKSSQRNVQRNASFKLQSKSNKVADSCSDSDDDFVTKDKSFQKKDPQRVSPVINYKVRKKRKGRKCEFLELSAELSGASHDSGDELTDDSLGSVAEFICDETHNEAVDMQAHYLRSVKSPVKGMFKIPELPRRCNNVLSQPFVDDDDYEMDSFCVEGNIGLTQAQDISELELAELKLKRKKKKKFRKVQTEQNETVDSPVAKARKPVRRVIRSDSDSD